MATKVTLKVEGLRQLGEKFAKLDEKTQKKVIRSAVRKSAALVRDFAKSHHSNWQNQTGSLEAAISTRRATKESRPGLEVWVLGVFKTRSRAGKNTSRLSKDGKVIQLTALPYYWKFLEYGTVKMTARPFLRPALDANKQKASDKMAEVLAEELKKAVAEL